MPFQKTFPLSLALLIGTVACASVSSKSTVHPVAPGSGPATAVATNVPKGGVPKASEPPAVLEDEAVSAPAGDKVSQLIDTMQDLYNSGLDAHKAGRYDEARDYFDRAVETALNADIDIDALEGDLYADGTAKGEEPPKDELKDITSYLSPEEASKEREKVQSASGAVTYDIPVVLNDQVLTFIEAFQTRMRGPFEAGLRRSGRYLPMISIYEMRQMLPEAEVKEEVA